MANGERRSVDVAIIGAGVTGLSIAWQLARTGDSRVVVIERSGIGAGASGVQPGGVRQQWGTRISCELAVESVAFYRRLDRQLEPRTSPRLDPCGYAFLADSTRELERLRRGVALQNELRIPSRLVDTGELERLVPGLTTTGVVGAAWCAEDGYFDQPQAVVEAFGEAAQRAGARIELGHVERVIEVGGRWQAVLADGRSIEAEQMVVAAGGDTVEVLRELAVDLPIEKQARYLFMSDPIQERLLDPLVVASERRFAAKQLANGRVLASDLAADGDLELGRKQWRANIAAAIRSLVPVLEFASFPLLVEGTYDVTPDHQPILGAVADRPGLWIAAGFSGHGFMIAPAVGRILADAIRGAGEDPALDELSVSRFDTRELDPELQIV